jgi:UDPglucose 6-dehydrogenase
LKAGGIVKAYDPIAIKETKSILGDKIIYYKSEYNVFEGAYAILFVTEWTDFRSPDFDKIKRMMNNPIIFDGRNLFESKELNVIGLEHDGIGAI